MPAAEAQDRYVAALTSACVRANDEPSFDMTPPRQAPGAQLRIPLLVLLASACAQPDFRAASTPPSGSLEPAALAYLGSSGTDPLYRVSGAAVVDSFILVANAGSNQLLVYSVDGTFLRAAGNEGAGPGEFRSLRWIQPVGHRLFVYDSELGRVSQFSSGGTFLGSVNIRPTAPFAFAQPLGLFPDHSFLVLASTTAVAAPPPGAVYRDTVALLRYGAAGEFVDSIGAYEMTEGYADTFGSSGHVMWELPGGKASALVVSGWHYYVIQNDAPLITSHDTTGATTREFREPHPSVQTIPEHYLDVLRERLVPPELPFRDRMREIVQRIPFPTDAPPYGWIGSRRLSMLRVADDGSVWALRFGGLPGSLPTWVVFDSAGAVRGHVVADQELDILYCDAQVALVHRWDELDTETVELRRIQW